MLPEVQAMGAISWPARALPPLGACFGQVQNQLVRLPQVKARSAGLLHIQQ